MTMGTKIVFIITLIVSIIVPFGYYLLGEKSRKRYKRAIGTNAFFFFGAFAIASIMLLGGPNVQAAEAVTADAGFATGMGYLAAAIVTGLSCIGGGFQRGFQRSQPAQRLCQAGPVGMSRRAGGLVRRGDALQQGFECCFCHKLPRLFW